MKLLFYQVAVVESDKIFKDLLKDESDEDDLRDSGKLFRNEAPL
jgi:hypothetical protein